SSSAVPSPASPPSADPARNPRNWRHGMTALPDIRGVGVVGAGLMGAGIAEVCARAGLGTVVREITPEAADAGRRRVTASLDRAVRTGKLAEADRDAALERL